MWYKNNKRMAIEHKETLTIPGETSTSSTEDLLNRRSFVLQNERDQKENISSHSWVDGETTKFRDVDSLRCTVSLRVSITVYQRERSRAGTDGLDDFVWTCGTGRRRRSTLRVLSRDGSRTGHPIDVPPPVPVSHHPVEVLQRRQVRKMSLGDSWRSTGRDVARSRGRPGSDYYRLWFTTWSRSRTYNSEICVPLSVLLYSHFRHHRP